MQDISEEMQNAASQLRRQDPAEASNRSGRALEKLKELERRLQGSQPSDRKRALGDLQLEARQLADAQRQISSELGQLQKSGDGQKTADAMRRLAGEKDRVADRVDRLQSAVKQLANTPSAEPAKEDRAALAEAAGELQRQRLAERMRQSAAKMRGAAAQPDKREMAFPTDKGGKADQNVPDSAKSNAKAGAAGERDEAAGNETMPQPQAEQELARALDRVADKLGAAAGGQDAESRKLSEQLARTQALRDRLGKVERDLERLAKEGNDEGKPGTGQQTDRPTGDSKPASQSDRSQQNGRSGAQGGSQGDRGAEMQRLREQYARELRQAQDLMDQLRREAAQGSGLGGFTPEGQQMVLSAPGTEAFKQDFAKWGVLRKNVNTALEQLEMSLSKKLQAKQSKDRLAAGAADRAPDAYRTLVDKYFQSLATGRKP
jgi:hypothetical protein